MTNTYASLNIIEIVDASKLVVSKISISSEGCVLSGGWVFELADVEQIGLVISKSRVLPIGSFSDLSPVIKKYSLRVLATKDFFVEAARDVELGIQRFEEFKAEDVKKRKNLIVPNFYNWPSDVDLNKSSEVLESLGMAGTIEGTATAMSNVMPAARLIKFFVDKWLLDEAERKSKKFVTGKEAEITILPTCWLN
jgi:hypothetical protein